MTSSVDDPLNKILTELPVPGDDMLAHKNVSLTLDLIQQTRDNLGEFFFLLLCIVSLMDLFKLVSSAFEICYDNRS